jgi:hypothetical protein
MLIENADVENIFDNVENVIDDDGVEISDEMKLITMI